MSTTPQPVKETLPVNTDSIQDYIDPMGRFRLLPDVIRRQRIAMNVSAQVLARKAGVHPQSLYAYERGTRLPYPSTAVRLAEALGLELFEMGVVSK